MNDLNTKYFFADTLEQAVMQAARHYRIHPDEVAYARVEKRHGFLRLRRRVVIEVDPDSPRRPPSREPDHTLTSTLPESAPKRRRRGRGSSSRKRKEQSQPQRDDSRRRTRGRKRGGPKPKDRVHAPPQDEAQETSSPASPSGSPRERTEAHGAKKSEKKGEIVELPATPRRASERYSPATGEIADAAHGALQQMLEFSGLELKAEVLQGDDRLEVELSGEDEKRVLDDHGRVLLAIQHLLPRLVRDAVGEGVPCRVDCDNFHEIREEQLRDLAQRAANEVSRNGRAKTLAPMRPEERRIVHIALSDDAQVETQSRGRGLFKRVEIRPRG